MIIYIVVQKVMYEGDTNMFVTSNEEKAKEYQKKANDNKVASDVSYIIETWEDTK